MTAPCANRIAPDIAKLRNALAYDPETGIFRWKNDRPHGRRIGCGNAGDIAGCPDRDGYILIRFDMRIYKAHRLAWFYVHGECPRIVDHINRVTSDNRLCNLRAADESLNNANTTKVRARSGIRGVSMDVRGRWRASIRIDGKGYHLGYFKTKEAAAVAYKARAQQAHGQFFAGA